MEDDSMRRHIRYSSDIPIEYDLVDVVYDQKDPLNNISLGGLCFRSERYIEQGITVLIQIPLINPAFEGMGIVVWCKKNIAFYDVGVQFIDEETDLRNNIVENIYHIERYKRKVFEEEGRKLSGEQATMEWMSKYTRDFVQ